MGVSQNLLWTCVGMEPTDFGSPTQIFNPKLHHTDMEKHENEENKAFESITSPPAASNIRLPQRRIITRWMEKWILA